MNTLQRPSRTTLLPTLAALTAVVLWGASFPAMKVAVQALGVWPLMWARMTLALLVLLPVAKRLAPKRLSRRDAILLGCMALLQPCAYFLCESKAMLYTSSAQAGVVAASMPLMMAIGGWLVLKERVTLRLWLGVAISCTGVAWLTSAGGPGNASAPNPLLGNLFELLAMVCATGSSLCICKLAAQGATRWNTWTLTGVQTTMGALFFLPGAPAVLAGVTTWPGEVTLSVLYLSLASSLGAFGLYNWALGRMPASRAGSFINLVPVAAVFFGWLVLGEMLTTMQCLATALVMGGVVLGTRTR